MAVRARNKTTLFAGYVNQHLAIHMSDSNYTSDRTYYDWKVIFLFSFKQSSLKA